MLRIAPPICGCFALPPRTRKILLNPSFMRPRETICFTPLPLLVGGPLMSACHPAVYLYKYGAVRCTIKVCPVRGKCQKKSPLWWRAVTTLLVCVYPTTPVLLRRRRAIPGRSIIKHEKDGSFVWLCCSNIILAT